MLKMAKKNQMPKRLGSLVELSLTLLLITFSSNFLFAADSLYMAGAVPLDESRPPATDLVVDGEIKTPDQLVQLRKKGVDLSTLNPRTDTSIWQDNVGLALDKSQDQLDINLQSETDYISLLPSRSGYFRFAVRQTNSDQNQKVFRVLAGKNAHGFLLRKNLLRKLGYQVPPVLYAPQLRVRFRGEISKKEFIEKMAGTTLGDPKRWIISGQEEGQTTLVIQDVILFSDSDAIYNLSSGYLSQADHIRGRRVLNSLLLPYSLVNVQESVNGFSWVLGRTVNNQIIFPTENAEEFTATLDDAKWMMRRIAQLTRNDFEEIVRECYYPNSVQLLLVEKLISRRNTAAAKLGLNAPELPFQVKVSAPPELVGGELEKEWWNGHAARYSYPDPESPLSDAEIRAFFKAKGISTAIESLAQMFDDAFLKGTDIEKKVIEKQIDAARKEFYNFLKTGKYKKTPLGFFAFPTIDGDIWASRDIVTGDYMGAENVIQLADTIEMTVAPGVFVGAVGAPEGVQIQAGAQIRVGRSYTHLKPIKSIRRALKEPYRNLLVNLVKKESGAVFDELLTPDFEGIDDAKKLERLKELLKTFNETMATGDSFIISDNISGDAYVGAGYNFTQRLKVQASLYGSRISLRRLHITKVNENTIHIYKSRGDAGIRGIQVSVEAMIPIVTFRHSKMKGTAETDYYSLDINPQTLTTLELTSNLLALREVLKEGSLELVKRQSPPFLVDHDFREKVTDVSFLFLDNKSIFSHDKISVTHPQGGTRRFLRQTMGVQKGEDYQGLTVDVINAIFEDAFDTKIEIPNPGSGDPGDTFKGKSNLRNAVLEVALADDQHTTVESFFKVEYGWKGWKIKDKKMRELISDINEKFNAELFSPNDFLNATSYDLYAVNVEVFVYQSAIETLLTLPEKNLKKILEENALWPESRPRAGETPLGFQSRMEEEKARKIRWALKYRREFSDKKTNLDRDAMTAGLKFMSSIEVLLPFEIFAQLVGGPENYFVHGQIRAFREGDENGDLPILANTLGQIGSESVRGPLADIRSAIGIAENEFFINWLLVAF